MGSANLLKESTIRNLDDHILEAFQEIGQILADARKEQNLTITQVASKIHIRQRYLIDLEEGQLADLPGRVYILGFIRTYARLLNLDGEELIRRVSKSPHIPDYEKSQISIPMRPEEEPSYYALAGSILLILCVSIGGYLFLKPASTTVTPLAGIMGAETALPQQPPVLAVTEPVPDILKPELSPIELQPKVSKEYSSPVMPKIIYPENMPTVVSPVEPVAKEPNAQNSPKLIKKVTIKATEPSWVEVRDDSKRVIFMKVLKTKEEYTVPEKPGITISTGNAGGIEIFVGETKLPILGGRGEVKRDLRVETLQ
jgi:cytoskeleton protein RodZ